MAGNKFLVWQMTADWISLNYKAAQIAFNHATISLRRFLGPTRKTFYYWFPLAIANVLINYVPIDNGFTRTWNGNPTIQIQRTSISEWIIIRPDMFACGARTVVTRSIIDKRYYVKKWPLKSFEKLRLRSARKVINNIDSNGTGSDPASSDKKAHFKCRIFGLLSSDVN